MKADDRAAVAALQFKLPAHGSAPSRVEPAAYERDDGDYGKRDEERLRHEDAQTAEEKDEKKQYEESFEHA